MKDQKIELPPLPEAATIQRVWEGYPHYSILKDTKLYTEQQVREAQQAAIEADRAALQSQDAGDPLQPAANWLNEAVVDLTATDIQRRLFVGYNRAQRLLDHARRNTA